MHIDILRRRFFAKIAADPSSECILWTAALRDGYGLLHVDGKLVQATHVSWFLKHGVWPVLDMLHTCDNPPCVNPEHLFEGTDADNAADRDAKGRQRSLSGMDVWNAKLTGLEVSEIIALTNTRMTNAEIGALFDVGEVYVSSLRHGRYQSTPQGLSRKPKGCTRIDIAGELLTIDEIAAKAGVGGETIRQRVKRGLTGEDLMAGSHKATRAPYVRRR